MIHQSAPNSAVCRPNTSCTCSTVVEVLQHDKMLSIKSLPNDKMIDWSKFKAFQTTINVAKIAKFVFDRVENIAEKGENAGYQHIPLFPQCFTKASF